MYFLNVCSEPQISKWEILFCVSCVCLRQVAADMRQMIMGSNCNV